MRGRKRVKRKKKKEINIIREDLLANYKKMVVNSKLDIHNLNIIESSENEIEM